MLEPHIYYRKKENRYEGRYLKARTAEGKAIYGAFYGRTEAEVRDRLDGIMWMYEVDGLAPLSLADALKKLKFELELRGCTENTIKHHLCFVGIFARETGHEENLNTLSVDDIKTFLHKLRYEKKYEVSTCNSYRAAIFDLFNYVLGRYVPTNVVPAMRGRKKLQRVLTKEEIARLLDALGDKMHRMIAVVIYSAGLRVSEAVSLRISDIRRDKMLIFIENGKGRKDRYAKLSERCLKELEDYWREFRPKYYFFPSSHSGVSHVTAHCVEDRMRDAGVKAGLGNDITPHTLRRSYATHLIENETGMFQTRDALGHASLRTTQQYVRLSDLNIRSPYDTW